MTTNARILVAPSFALADNIAAMVTIEAEYGALVCQGVLYTAAHHQADGPYRGTHLGGPAVSPCVDESIPVVYSGVVLLSHVDLDSIGGALRALGHPLMHRDDELWSLAAYVDVHGPHRRLDWRSLDDMERDDDLLERPVRRALVAWWAYSSERRISVPRDRIVDVTPEILAAASVLEQILDGDEELLAAGDRWAAAEAELERSSLLYVLGSVAARQSDRFVSHLYSRLDGARLDRAIVGYNTQTRAVTVSLESPVEGVSARGIVRAIWGDEAGGHTGIAGSPRGVDMTRDDLDDAVALTYACLVRAAGGALDLARSNVTHGLGLERPVPPGASVRWWLGGREAQARVVQELEHGILELDVSTIEVLVCPGAVGAARWISAASVPA